jgi:hypothetical protein
LAPPFDVEATRPTCHRSGSGANRSCLKPSNHRPY